MAKVELLKIIISTQLPALFPVSLLSSCTSSLSLSLSSRALPFSLSFLLALVSLILVECAQLVCTHVNSDLKPFYLRFIPFYFVLPLMLFAPFVNQFRFIGSLSSLAAHLTLHSRLRRRRKSFNNVQNNI